MYSCKPSVPGSPWIFSQSGGTAGTTSIINFFDPDLGTTNQALRVGLDLEGSDVRGLAIPATRAILSMALGRENVVHLALIAPAAAARVNQALGRWRGFIGLDG